MHGLVMKIYAGVCVRACVWWGDWVCGGGGGGEGGVGSFRVEDL